MSESADLGVDEGVLNWPWEEPIGQVDLHDNDNVEVHVEGPLRRFEAERAARGFAGLGAVQREILFW